MGKNVSLAIIFLFLIGFSFAQTINVTGIVVATSDKLPLSSVTVDHIGILG